VWGFLAKAAAEPEEHYQALLQTVAVLGQAAQPEVQVGAMAAHPAVIMAEAEAEAVTT
jgi:hypothetical protein